ncbi:hypothetical protein GCM10009601_61090 [Streptomyces thermospinosisporus]|uniref:Uncharacterized protein n=1 Tax=Streptomyces thermospinosisporus TaxID=161482 RepID=A0ABP4JXX5_9ACTN
MSTAAHGIARVLLVFTGSPGRTSYGRIRGEFVTALSYADELTFPQFRAQVGVERAKDGALSRDNACTLGSTPAEVNALRRGNERKATAQDTAY